MCNQYSIPYLGGIPLDQSVGLAGERGSKVDKDEVQATIDKIIHNMHERIRKNAGGA